MTSIRHKTVHIQVDNMKTILEFQGHNGETGEMGTFRDTYKMSDGGADVIAQLCFKRQYIEAEISNVLVNGKKLLISKEVLRKINSFTDDKHKLRTAEPVR